MATEDRQDGGLSPLRQKREPKKVDLSLITAEAEKNAGVSLKELAGIFLLDRLKGFGPQKFKQIHLDGHTASDILANPAALKLPGSRGADFRAQISAFGTADWDLCFHRAGTQILAACKHHARIITFQDSSYPRNVFASNNPVPVLYVRGGFDVIKGEATVACVGSRKIRLPYSELQESFARHAVLRERTVVSGFALGADSIAHRAAIAAGGKTVCVMAGGLERPFPPENKDLWEQFLRTHKAVFVTEFGFGTRASSLNLRKRNKLIVAFSRAVVVGQSSAKGGAMNAYRFARDQRKPVATFVDDGADDTSGNRLIANAHVTGDSLFSTLGNTLEYDEWLQRVSSST